MFEYLDKIFSSKSNLFVIKKPHVYLKKNILYLGALGSEENSRLSSVHGCISETVTSVKPCTEDEENIPPAKILKRKICKVS